MPGFIGFPELLLLLLVGLLLFGPKRMPEMGRSLGRGMREFKDSITAPTEQGALRASATVGEEPAGILASAAEDERPPTDLAAGVRDGPA